MEKIEILSIYKDVTQPKLGHFAVLIDHGDGVVGECVYLFQEKENGPYMASKKAVHLRVLMRSNMPNIKLDFKKLPEGAKLVLLKHFEITNKE